MTCRTAGVAFLPLAIVFLASATPSATNRSGPKSTIINFSPASFPVKAATKFFYSIGKELKYSDRIDPQAPTLVRSSVQQFLVSPDESRIAIVADGTLLIVGEGGVLAEVAHVDSISRHFKPIGRQFFRDSDFQWSADSKSLFLIRDEFYRSKGVQLFSPKGELWRYDVDARRLSLVLKPFAAHSYSFGGISRIYYSEPTPRGELQLKMFDGRSSTIVGEPNAKDTTPREPDGTIVRPFYSFSLVDYEKALAWLNVRLVDRDGIEDLVIHERNYLSVTQGKGWGEYYYCADMLRSVFLPGDKFFLLNTPFCGNYDGQLLFDLDSGRYQTLPRNTVVFRTLNTRTLSFYRVTSSGIEVGPLVRRLQNDRQHASVRLLGTSERRRRSLARTDHPR